MPRRALLLLSTLGVTAHVSAAAQTLAVAESLARVGDTAAAIAIYEAWLERSRRDAEAHYRVGLLYWSRSLDDGPMSADRRAAEEHLRYATRYESDSAKYWLGLADVFRRATEASMRVQWGAALRRARETALANGSPILPLVEYQAGRMSWEQYERHGRRWTFPIGQPGQLPAANSPTAWRDMENMLETTMRPLNSWEGAYQDALSHLDRAARLDPGHVAAVGLLGIALGERDRWAEALEATTALIAAAPDSARAWLVHGMVLARVGRYADAQAAQERGLSLWDGDSRARYEDLARILPRRRSRVWHEATSAEREADGALYWSVAQPLLITGANEIRTEYLARVTYVDLRWSEPFGPAGWESDRGSVYVRWGPPEVWGTLDDNYTFWAYPDLRLFFAFKGRSGFTYARFADEHQFVYEDRAEGHPASFANVPALRRIDSAVVQVAQFRGPRPDSTDVAIFGFVPVGRMTRAAPRASVALRTAAYVRDERFDAIADEVHDDRVTVADSTQFERRSWRFFVPPGERVIRVEANTPELERGARSQQIIEVRRFDGDSLQLSDVLVARRLEPRDSTPESWRDFLIEPSPGLLAPGEQLGLLWETYNLAPDSSGVVHYAVEISVRVGAILREGGLHVRIVGGMLDAMGLSARGDERLALSYEVEAPAASNGRHVDYLVVDFDRVPSAGYEVTVTIVDLVTGSRASARRHFAVDPVEPGAR